MALNFLPSSEMTLNVVATCDPSVICSDDQRVAYMSSASLDDLESYEGATILTIKALSPREREEAEVKAGAYTRSELGRVLWASSPDGIDEKARWHHELEEDERRAYGEYQGYIQRVYIEMIKSSLIKIDGEDASWEMIDNIRPDSYRLQVISELVIHIQRSSLLGTRPK